MLIALGGYFQEYTYPYVLVLRSVYLVIFVGAVITYFYYVIVFILVSSIGTNSFKAKSTDRIFRYILIFIWVFCSALLISAPPLYFYVNELWSPKLILLVVAIFSLITGIVMFYFGRKILQRIDGVQDEDKKRRTLTRFRLQIVVLIMASCCGLVGSILSALEIKAFVVIPIMFSFSCLIRMAICLVFSKLSCIKVVH